MGGSGLGQGSQTTSEGGRRAPPLLTCNSFGMTALVCMNTLSMSSVKQHAGAVKWGGKVKFQSRGSGHVVPSGPQNLLAAHQAWGVRTPLEGSMATVLLHTACSVPVPTALQKG